MMRLMIKKKIKEWCIRKFCPKKIETKKEEIVEVKKTNIYELAEQIDPLTINAKKINRVLNRQGGSISWRNNNSGNLKMVYDEAVGQGSYITGRSYENAMKRARELYEGVLALDRYGYMIFETLEAGNIARRKFLVEYKGDKTVRQMVKVYARDDYTGKANHALYTSSIFRIAEEMGVDLKGKKIKNMSDSEINALMRGMEIFEGFKEGTEILS